MPWQRIITTFGIIAMVIVFGGSLARAGQKLTAGSFGGAAVADSAGVSATVDADGVQRVTLSFARFNYTPDTIRLRRGVPAEIIGDTTKLQGCFTSFASPDLNVWGQFRPGSERIAFTPTKDGTFRFSCAMGMGAGRFIVEG